MNKISLEKLIVIMLSLAVFVTPMGAQAFTIDTPIGRLSLLRIIIFICILMCFLDQLMSGKRLLISRKNNRYSTVFLLVWMTYSIISVTWAKDFSSWLRYIYFIVIGVFSLILFINYFKNTYLIENAFVMMNLGFFIQSIIGWYEIVTRDYKYVNAINLYQYSVKMKSRVPIAMSGNPNEFAMQMFMGIIISLFCVSKFKNKIIKMVFALMAINDFVLLMMTLSRGVILGFGISIACLMLVGGKKRSAFIILLIAIALTNAQAVSYIVGLFSRNQYEIRSDNTRMNLIMNGLDMVYQSFGFGVGCGQCPYWLQYRAKIQTEIYAMHNWWIEILASSGVFIFVAYIVYYLRMLKSYYTLYRSSIEPKTKSFAILIYSMMIGFIIASISSSSNFTNESLWIIWGLLICYQGLMYDDIGIMQNSYINRSIYRTQKTVG